MENMDKDEKRRRPRRPKQQIQKNIIDAVSSLVKEKCFSNITISTISQKSEVDVNAILSNFGSIENLLDIYFYFFDFWFLSTLNNQERFQKNPIRY